MIEPVLFNYNSETAVNNYYQSNDLTLSNEKVQQKAHDEFSEFVSLLRSKGVNVFVFKDTTEPHTPHIPVHDHNFQRPLFSFHLPYK